MTVAPETINVDRPTPTLTQVGHEGNPVLFDLPVVGVLDSPNPFTPGSSGPGDLGGPVLYPIGGGSGGGGGGQAPINPMAGGSGTLNCVSGNDSVNLTVTGGVGPYSWSTTAGVLGASSTSIGQNTLSAAPNPHPETAGVAQGACMHFCSVLGFPDCRGWERDCNGDIITCGSTSIASVCAAAGITCPCADCGSCSNLVCTSDSHVGCCNLPTCFPDADCEGVVGAYGTQVDMRTGGMVAAGCNPCIVQFITPPVITVTDSQGNSVAYSVDVEYTP